MSTPECGTCVYSSKLRYHEDEDVHVHEDPTIRLCRYNPPAPLAVLDPHGYPHADAFWPVVSANDWCRCWTIAWGGKWEEGII